MFSNILRYYHTLKHLKWIQVKYRLLYLLKRKINPTPTFNTKTIKKATGIKMSQQLYSNQFYLGNNSFEFLNLQQSFDKEIDWNFNEHGKLWTYNLNYFEFLLQAEMTKETGLQLIHDFIKKRKVIKDGMEPFPLALRIVFWIKFLARHQIKDDLIDSALYSQLQHLQKHLEYHLMGNHLLENAFSLLIGGSYFNDRLILKRAGDLLKEQLTEQILKDGAHFELSPMYHNIMLYRMLDVINVLQNNILKVEDGLVTFLQDKAEVMLSWMVKINFGNGDMPRVNDTAPGVAPDSKSLLEYARRLKLKPASLPLKESGYRKFENETYELLIDVGRVGPDYIPGHAHSDTFNFILHYRQQPLLVDTGISTYEKNARRNWERSTAAHNTVMVGGEEQSEMWGGFRVARRAKVNQLHEVDNQIEASHDGYDRIGAAHSRTFQMSAHELTIEDKVTTGFVAEAYFHFHPAIKIETNNNSVLGEFGKIEFQNASEVLISPYQYAQGFNKTQTASKVIVKFKELLSAKIVLK